MRRRRRRELECGVPLFIRGRYSEYGTHDVERMSSPRRLGSLIGAVFGLIYVLVNRAPCRRLPRSRCRRIGVIAFVLVLTAVARSGAARSRRPARVRPGLLAGRGGRGRGARGRPAPDQRPARRSRGAVAWVSFVVGAHFVALAVVFGERLFLWLGGAIGACGLAGLGLAAPGAGPAPIAAVSGVIPGLVLLASGWWGARSPARRAHDARTRYDMSMSPTRHIPIDDAGPAVRDVMLREPRAVPPGHAGDEVRETFANPRVKLLLVADGDRFLGTVGPDDLPADGDGTIADIVRADAPRAGARTTPWQRCWSSCEETGAEPHPRGGRRRPARGPGLLQHAPQRVLREPIDLLASIPSPVDGRDPPRPAASCTPTGCSTASPWSPPCSSAGAAG